MCYNKLVSKARKKRLQLSAIIYNTSNGDVRRLQYTQGHIVIDVRHVGFDMSDNRSDGDRCNKKGHKTKKLSQQV